MLKSEFYFILLLFLFVFPETFGSIILFILFYLLEHSGQSGIFITFAFNFV